MTLARTAWRPRVALSLAGLASACTPPSGANAPRPHVPASPASGATVADTDWRSALAAFPAGCFARSPHALACMTSHGSTATGQTFAIAWVSVANIDREVVATVDANTFDPPTLTPAIADRVVARLRRERFVALDAPLADSVAASDTARLVLAGGSLALRWRVDRIANVDTADGSWERTQEQLEVRASRACTFDIETREGVTTRVLRAWPLEGVFVIERSLSFATEGEHGGSTDVFVVAHDAPCPSSS